jgi:hypothetical protein
MKYSDLRRTGRTTRIVDEAIATARLGQDVDLIARTRDHAHGLALMILEQSLGRGLECQMALGQAARIAGAGTIRIRRLEDPGVLLGLGRVTGTDDRVLADHFALEGYLERAGGWAWWEWLARSFDAEDGG